LFAVISKVAIPLQLDAGGCQLMLSFQLSAIERALVEEAGTKRYGLQTPGTLKGTVGVIVFVKLIEKVLERNLVATFYISEVGQHTSCYRETILCFSTREDGVAHLLEAAALRVFINDHPLAVIQ